MTSMRLSIAENDLRELPPTLRMLKQLSKLDVRCNPIATDALRLAASRATPAGTCTTTSWRRSPRAHSRACHL
mgnify:CR=1 FL=1